MNQAIELANHFSSLQIPYRPVFLSCSDLLFRAVGGRVRGRGRATYEAGILEALNDVRGQGGGYLLVGVALGGLGV